MILDFRGEYELECNVIDIEIVERSCGADPVSCLHVTNISNVMTNKEPVERADALDLRWRRAAESYIKNLDQGLDPDEAWKKAMAQADPVLLAARVQLDPLDSRLDSLVLEPESPAAPKQHSCVVCGKNPCGCPKIAERMMPDDPEHRCSDCDAVVPKHEWVFWIGEKEPFCSKHVRTKLEPISDDSMSEWAWWNSITKSSPAALEQPDFSPESLLRGQEASESLATPDEDLARKICNFMNELLELDSKAVLDLCNNRVPCNQDVADHGTVQVIVSKTNKYKVGLIGILNGICGIYKDGWGPICVLYHKNGSVIRFGLTKEERVNDLCKVCGGRGVISDSHRKDYDCPSCDGDGKNPQTKESNAEN